MKPTVSLLLSSLLLSILFISSSLEGHAAISRLRTEVPAKDSLETIDEAKMSSEAAILYESLDLASRGLSRKAFAYAMQGFNYLRQNGTIRNDEVISIVDFSLPSSSRRLFVIDLARKEVLFYTYVAHGQNSGKEYAERFSNKPESNKSSLGFYRTGTTYQGAHGYSLKLEGLEKGINDNADRRDIVIHGAAYVSEALVRVQGYLGRSLGCPALPEKLHKPIIDRIRNGTCLFIYGKDQSYPAKSKILREA